VLGTSAIAMLSFLCKLERQHSDVTLLPSPLTPHIKTHASNPVDGLCLVRSPGNGMPQSLYEITLDKYSKHSRLCVMESLLINVNVFDVDTGPSDARQKL